VRRGPILEVKTPARGSGSSGVQITFIPTSFWKGYRPKRYQPDLRLRLLIDDLLGEEAPLSLTVA